MIVGRKLIDGNWEADIKEGSVFTNATKIPNTDTYEVHGLTRWGNSPFKITSAQGKMMLRISGKREQVEQIISQQDEIVQDYFRDGWDWERTSPIIWSLAPTIFDTTDETELNNALDDFFQRASELR